MPLQYHMSSRINPTSTSKSSNVQALTWKKPLLSRPPLTGGFTSPRKQSTASINPEATSNTVPESCFFITRAHFKIVKCMHHLNSLQRSVPPSLKKTAWQLHKQLHPAFVDEEFIAAAHALSDEWLSKVCLLMSNHYLKTQQEAENLIIQNPISSNLLSNSLELVKKWAKKQLSRRLRPANLEAALERIRDLQPISDLTQVSFTRTPTTIRRDTATQTSTPISSSICPPTSNTIDESVLISHPNGTSSSAPELTISNEVPPSASHDNSTIPIASNESIPPIQPSEIAPQALKCGDHHKNAPLSQRPTNPKKRTFDSCSLTQLDLFGESLSSAPSPRRRALNNPTWKKRVVCGDSNLSSFEYDDCLVLAHERGRLSHFKDLLRSIEEPCNLVDSFVIVLSTLDKGNCFLTNQTSLKSLLGSARRLFPNAKCFVQLCGISDSFTQAEKDNLHDLNNYVILKSPSSCVHIPAPSTFETENNHNWSSDTRSKIFESLRNFLD